MTCCEALRLLKFTGFFNVLASKNSFSRSSIAFTSFIVVNNFGRGPAFASDRRDEYEELDEDEEDEEEEEEEEEEEDA